MHTKRTPISRVLSQYVNKGWTSAAEIGSLLGCSERRVYKIVNEGDGNFHDWEIQTLCQHFSSQGRNELSRLFVSGKFTFTPTGEIKINGCLLDENGEITKIMGELMSLHAQGGKERGLELCDELIQQVRSVRAEIKNMD